MRSKRGGFKAFVRRRDGKTPVPEASHNELAKVSITRLDSLQRVLQGEYSKLLSSFTWVSTPQGVSYWNDRDRGETPLSPEDYKWLQELYDYHVQRQ